MEEIPPASDEITIIGGTYFGCRGWLNRKKKPTRCFTPVIVEIKKKNGEEGEVERAPKRIRHYNIGYMKSDVPKSFEEAILQQHTDIHRKLTELTKLLAGCKIRDEDNMARLFLEHLHLHKDSPKTDRYTSFKEN